MSTKNSEELLSCMKVPPEFELDEDQEIEFDPIEDSESRPSSYLARIVTLIKIETENVPLMTPLTTKARQEAHKRKMEILDQTILQLSKRPKANPQILSSPFSGPDSPSTPIPSSSRRKLKAGFETRPFNSPLINRSKASKPMVQQTILDPILTPTKPNQDAEGLHTEASENKPDYHHKKLKNSIKPSQPILEPIHPLFSNLDPTKSHHRAEEQGPIPTGLDRKKSNKDVQQDHDHQNLDQLNAHPPHPLLLQPSNPPNALPNSPSSSSSNCFDRISKKKTLKINWDSYFQPAKPS